MGKPIEYSCGFNYRNKLSTRLEKFRRCWHTWSPDAREEDWTGLRTARRRMRIRTRIPPEILKAIAPERENSRPELVACCTRHVYLTLLFPCSCRTFDRRASFTGCRKTNGPREYIGAIWIVALESAVCLKGSLSSEWFVSADARSVAFKGKIRK